MSATKRYKEYTPEDRVALKELREECQRKLGQDITLLDMLRAVEPLEDTPEHLKDL